MKFHKGDIVLVDLNPVKGHEQGNKRPVLVINNYTMFGNVNIILPISSKSKSLPIEVSLDSRTKTQGVVLPFQIKTVDLVNRQAQFLEKAPEDIVALCCEAIVNLIEYQN